ncbi:MAG: family 1 extracellular solute-binding protein [Paenibacillus sp.]|jgi:multiple sugar transport system substrate-binding protein|nr:family 1 extracellular solute-binding protein [Paenibacillus sp.]
MNRKAIGVCAISAVAIALSGCGGGGGQPKQSEQAVGQATTKQAEPVELSLYVDLASELSEDEINEYIREPLKKKLPHITIGKAVYKGKGTERDTLIAAGTFPDLTYTTSTYIPQFRDLAIAQDLTALAKANGFDFNKTYQPVVMNTITTQSAGKMMGMPFSDNWFGTFYNKDIFDKFGVAYPKDLMSYDDAIEISKKITRQDGGTQYIGLDARSTVAAALGLSLPHIDPVTLKSNYNTEAFRPVFQLFKDLYAIPGQVGPKGETAWSSAGFFDTRNVGMYIHPVYAHVLKALAVPDVKWDAVTVLNFKQAVGTEREPDYHLFMMSTTSKHQTEAFQVMAMLASEEVQRSMARNGRIPAALQFSQFQSDYAAKLPAIKDKNWAGIFKAKKRDMSVQTPYQTVASAVLATANKRLATETIDVNTLMREIQAAADAKIEEEKAKKK